MVQHKFYRTQKRLRNVSRRPPPSIPILADKSNIAVTASVATHTTGIDDVSTTTTVNPVGQLRIQTTDALYGEIRFYKQGANLTREGIGRHDYPVVVLAAGTGTKGTTTAYFGIATDDKGNSVLKPLNDASGTYTLATVVGKT